MKVRLLDIPPLLCGIFLYLLIDLPTQKWEEVKTKYEAWKASRSKDQG